MGHRNPDRVPITARFARGRTIADMLRERWDVISKCKTCGLMMQTDLSVIAKLAGPGVVLWNRRARCRRLLCNGVVTFWAKAPGMDGHQELTINDREPDLPRAPRQPWLDEHGLSDADWQRIQALAVEVTPNHAPAALNDLSAPVRVGACAVGEEGRSSGRPIGRLGSCTILLWKMTARERQEWTYRTRRTGP